RALLVRARDGDHAAGVRATVEGEREGVGLLDIGAAVVPAARDLLDHEREAGRDARAAPRGVGCQLGKKREGAGIRHREERADKEREEQVIRPPTRIERATERALPVILQMIRDLAEFERMTADVVATEEGLREALFGPRPDAEVLLAYEGDE